MTDMNPAEFCREIETYLCRKNDGHLIRIVGPVFEQVCGWAAQGVPIKIAFRGIDRYFERQQASGRQTSTPRRRPIRVEFCEADILDAFDEWRRAVGITASALAGQTSAGANGAASSVSPSSGSRSPSPLPPPDSPSGGRGRTDTRAAISSDGPGGGGVDLRDGVEGVDGGAGHARRKPALLTHIDRAMARLTQRRVESGMGTSLGATIDRVLGELDTMRAGARGARGDARRALLDRLGAIDRELIEAARAALEASGTLDELRADAARELEPFRSRLSPDALRAATESALDRLVRDRWRLPTLRLDD